MVINKHYDHSVKGILYGPTRMFPHTRVSAMYPPVTCNRENKTLSTRLYLARLTRQKENKKILRIYKAYLAYGLLHLRKHY